MLLLIAAVLCCPLKSVKFYRKTSSLNFESFIIYRDAVGVPRSLDHIWSTTVSRFLFHRSLGGQTTPPTSPPHRTLWSFFLFFRFLPSLSKQYYNKKVRFLVLELTVVAAWGIGFMAGRYQKPVGWCSVGRVYP